MGTKTAVALGLASGPVAWAGTLTINYALTKWACSRGYPLLLVAAAVVGLAVVVAGAVPAWTALQTTPADAQDTRASEAGINRFLAQVALGSCALFIFALIALAVPPMVIHGCE